MALKYGIDVLKEENHLTLNDKGITLFYFTI
jgi:hypothetical protein